MAAPQGLCGVPSPCRDLPFHGWHWHWRQAQHPQRPPHTQPWLPSPCGAASPPCTLAALSLSLRSCLTSLRACGHDSSLCAQLPHLAVCSWPWLSSPSGFASPPCALVVVVLLSVWSCFTLLCACFLLWLTRNSTVKEQRCVESEDEVHPMGRIAFLPTVPFLCTLGRPVCRL